MLTKEINMTKSRPEYASVNELSEVNTVKIGDTVRSFDMELMPFSWVVGKVVGIEKKDGCDRYVIECDKWETCRDENGIHENVVRTEKEGKSLVYPPVNGTALIGGFNDYTNFVERV